MTITLFYRALTNQSLEIIYISVRTFSESQQACVQEQGHSLGGFLLLLHSEELAYVLIR